MKIKSLLAIATIGTLTSCASITNDPNVPISVSFSDNSSGTCDFQNKRMRIESDIPKVIRIRRSDDTLKYDCVTDNGVEAKGEIQSELGAMIAGNIILGGGIGAIVDSITDKHRNYPASFVIPVVKE